MNGHTPDSYTPDSQTPFDLVVIGAGPAGLLAAGRAASLGARVIVLEKNREPGKKLLITGGGRCNVTNAQFDIHTLVNRYGKEGRRLYSVLTGFGPRECMDFFQNLGVPMVVEAENRVFPGDHRAASIRDALVRFCLDTGVDLRVNHTVRQVKRIQSNQQASEPDLFQITTAKGQQFLARRLLVATGGFARPETGSTGDGFSWLQSMGHTIIQPEPILVPIKVKESWRSELMGLAFQDCGLTLYNPDGTRAYRDRGKVLFTHFGLSGPLILNYSSRIQDLASQWRQAGRVTIQSQSSSGTAVLPASDPAAASASVLASAAPAASSGHQPLVLYLDFFPATDGGQLDRQLAQACDSQGKKRVQTILADLVPPRLAQRVLQLANIPADKPAGQISKVQRKAVGSLLKEFPLTFGGKLGNDKAIVSRGGVVLDEVDFKTMESKKVPGLLLAGDIIDFDRPSGGFSLQICWSTGWRAGETAAG